MSAFVKWFNRHGASTVLFIILLGACVWFDFIARIRMDIANRQFANMDTISAHGMWLIDLVHRYYWLAATYFVIFFTCLMVLEFRSASRWVVWTIFILFALPVLFYVQTCVHIAHQAIVWRTQR